MKPWVRARVIIPPYPDISKLSFIQLKKLARERGVKFKPSVKKDELISLLEAEEQANLDYLDQAEEDELIDEQS